MKEYLVTWSIEIDADSPLQAAQSARRIQLDPANNADVFVVLDEDGDETRFSVLSYEEDPL